MEIFGLKIERVKNSSRNVVDLCDKLFISHEQWQAIFEKYKTARIHALKALKNTNPYIPTRYLDIANQSREKARNFLEDYKEIVNGDLQEYLIEVLGNSLATETFNDWSESAHNALFMAAESNIALHTAKKLGWENGANYVPKKSTVVLARLTAMDKLAFRIEKLTPHNILTNTMESDMFDHNEKAHKALELVREVGNARLISNFDRGNWETIESAIILPTTIPNPTRTALQSVKSSSTDISPIKTDPLKLD